MAKRSITDAERWLRDNAMSLNPEAYNQCKAAINEAKGNARQALAERTKPLYDDLVAQRKDVLQGLEAIRDNLRHYAKEAKLGVLTYDECRAHLKAVDEAERTFQPTVAQMTAAVASIQDAELGPREPTAWNDDGAPIRFGDRPEEWTEVDFFDRLTSTASGSHAMHDFPF